MKSLTTTFALVLLLNLAVYADESFDKYDTNSDKMVTYEELLRAKKFEFDKLDRNRDRTVTSEELSQLDDEPSKYELFHSSNFMTALGIEAASLFEYNEQVRRVINRLDTTADNAVSEAEYAAAVAEAKAKDAALAGPGE